MKLADVIEHVHYQPAQITPVCGFKKTVLENELSLKEETAYPLLKVRTTTDVRKVTCPQCVSWLNRAVSQLVLGTEVKS